MYHPPSAHDRHCERGSPLLLEMLPHLWKEAVMSKQFVLLGPSAQDSIHVLVAQVIPGITVDEFHARECPFILNAAMALVAALLPTQRLL